MGLPQPFPWGQRNAVRYYPSIRSRIVSEQAPTPPSAEHIAEAMERLVTGGQMPNHPEYGFPERSYIYRTPEGSFGAVNAYFSEGRSATWTLNGAGPAWIAPHLPIGLYAPQIAADGQPAVLCFDEEAADAARHLLPEHAAFAPLTPHPEESDLRIFARRAVLIWAPVGGDKTGRAWQKAIKPLAAAVKLLKPPPDKPLA